MKWNTSTCLYKTLLHSKSVFFAFLHITLHRMLINSTSYNNNSNISLISFLINQIVIKNYISREQNTFLINLFKWSSLDVEFINHDYYFVVIDHFISNLHHEDNWLIQSLFMTKLMINFHRPNWYLLHIQQFKNVLFDPWTVLNFLILRKIQ